METYSFDTSPQADTPVILSPPPPKVKLMYSYGGRIQPRPHDHRLTYAGGHTKILSVDRFISYSSLLARLSSLVGPNNNNLAIKYQLPGEDLDALVSIFDDDDLDHLMVEYDRLCSINPAKMPRLRLFLFPLGTYNKLSSLRTSDSDDANGWFVHAINYASKTIKPVNPDYLFGFDKSIISGISNPEKNNPDSNPNPQISGDINRPRVQEKPAPLEIPAAVSVPANFPGVQVPVSGGCYAVVHAVAGSDAPVYYIPATAGGYMGAGFQPMRVHGGQCFHGVHQQIMQPANLGFPEIGLGLGHGHVGYDASGRQVFYAVAAEGRPDGGAEGVDGNVNAANVTVTAQSQTSTA